LADLRHSLHVGDRLRESADRGVSFRWPVAIDERLDALSARAREVGQIVSRRELIAALVFGVDLSAEEISDLVRRYRISTVGDALLDHIGVNADNVVEFAQHRPGPRVRKP
jgi:hypothetical protein